MKKHDDLTMTIESVIVPHANGWAVEARCDGCAMATYGPFADLVFAKLMAEEIGRRTVELVEQYKVSKLDSTSKAHLRIGDPTYFGDSEH